MQHIAPAFLLLLWLCGLQIVRCQDVKQSTRAEAISPIDWHAAQKLGDGNPRTTYTLPTGTFGYAYATLPGVYNITTIEIDLLSTNKALFNKTFRIYTYPKYKNPCRIRMLSEWNLCVENAIIKESGMTASYECKPGAITAKHVVLVHGSPESEEEQEGPTITNIMVRGVKVGESEITPEPEPGELNRHHATRAAAFRSITQLNYEPSYAEFVFDGHANDIAMVWDNKKRIASMFYNRGNGSVLTIIGQKWMDEMLSPPYNSTLARNIREVLANQTGNNIAKASESYKDGDILLVSRNMSFDVNKVNQSVQSGKNFAVISFMGTEEKNPTDDTWNLLKALNIRVKLDNVVQEEKILNPDSLIDSGEFIPYWYDEQWRIKSWSGLCSREPRIDCVTITKDNRAVATSPEFQSQVRTLLEKYRRYFEDRAPCEAHPYKRDAKVKGCWNNYNLYAMCQMITNATSDKPIALYGTDIFPGRVAKSERAITHTVRYTPRFGGYYQPMGVYVNPGDVFSWKILNSSTDAENFRFTFSCFKDQLKGADSLNRWPYHQHGFGLTPSGSHATPMGGVLFLRMLKGTETVTIELNNVYRHQWFDLLNDSSIEDWDNERKRYTGVPWMALIGDNFHACLETKHMSKVNKEDLMYVVTYHDNSIKLMHNVRGSLWERTGAEVFATDVQLSAGWGHAGIPVMGYLPWISGFNDLDFVKNKSAIGFTHEFGHNIQNKAATFSGGTEVTNNVYHFFVRGHLCNLTAYGFDVHPGFGTSDMNDILRAWNQTAFGGINLGYYNWLGITFGEGLIVNLWRAMTEYAPLIKSDTDRAHLFLKTMCQETEHNILPWQELFHFPINDTLRQECGQHQCFFPNDNLTQMVPTFVDRVLAKYNNSCARTPKKQVETKFDIFYGLFTKRSQWIFFE